MSVLILHFVHFPLGPISFRIVVSSEQNRTQNY